MLERIIPSSGEKIPVTGIGTWEQFDVSLSAAERSSLTTVLTNLHQHGGRLIDSSPMYGRSEAVVGELTAAMPQANEFFYATKVWTSGRQEGIRQMEASMQKMKRKVMDLIQVHNLVDRQTHLQTLNNWKQEGKVRYTGITHYTVSSHPDLEKVIRSASIDFVQFNYSLRVRNAEKSLLPLCADKGVAVIINEPFEKGSLFRLTKNKPLPGWAAEYDILNWSQFFLKYILSHPAITVVIPGTSDPQHAIDNAVAGSGALPDEKGRKMMVELIEKM